MYTITDRNTGEETAFDYQIPRVSTPCHFGGARWWFVCPLSTNGVYCGRSGANGLPDLLDEARWGLEWMLKLHPAPEQFYHQVADDRDHGGWRLPPDERADYGWGKGGHRVVYGADGRPQWLGRLVAKTVLDQHVRFQEMNDLVRRIEVIEKQVEVGAWGRGNQTTARSPGICRCNTGNDRFQRTLCQGQRWSVMRIGCGVGWEWL